MTPAAAAARDHAHDQLRFNAPFHPERTTRVLELLDPPRGGTVLDLGCGWAELLLGLLAARRDLTGTGIDADPRAIGRAARRAAERGLSDRVALRTGDALVAEDAGDAVIAVGATHAWGATVDALTALRAHVAPGGRLLLGDGFWAAAPTPALVADFGEVVLDLPGLCDAARQVGWRVLDLSVASAAEWDDFESRWCRGLELFALQAEDAEQARAARDLAESHHRAYVSGYRGVLGFAYLVLTAAD